MNFGEGLNAGYIKDIVAGIFETYDTFNPFELCECLEIKIIKSNIGSDIKGFFQRTPDGCEIIHINSELDEKEMKYICAHELGHAILHTDLSMSFFIENTLQIKNRYEIKADKFAAELLLTRDLESYICEDMSADQLSSMLCVPQKLIKYKFNLDTPPPLFCVRRWCEWGDSL
jgi:Zn-dependent peptidase ImmA (M78 family)